MVVLKRAKVPCKDLRLLYTTCIISVLDYIMWYLCFTTICYQSLNAWTGTYTEEGVSNYVSGLIYNEALTRIDLVSLNEHHRNVCNALFNDIFNDKSHRLRYLFPPLHNFTRCTLRHTKSFQGLKMETNWAKNTLFISSILNFDTI